MGGLDLECVITFEGKCPIDHCGEAIYFIKEQLEAKTTVHCRQCGNNVNAESILNSIETKVNQRIIEMAIFQSRSTDLLAYRGIHNFEAKLLSPFLTRYGLDKDTGKPKLLSDMNMAASFDCGRLSNKVFQISQGDIKQPGVGMDESTELSGYLQGTLLKIDEASNQSKSCIPGHADPDGHCLVHAISRCLTGTQLFWHPLREELHRHLRNNLTKYQQLLGAYITECEWPLIVEEADPYYLSDGATLGLRNVHVFALANILKRPIILLDSPDCMDNAGDFSATFLPILTPPKYCKDKQDKLNSPIVIAWASRAHNHFVPIIPISATEVMLPNSIIPPVWLETQDKINEYCEFKYTEYCPRGVTIGHGTKLSDAYIKRLIAAMREAFHTEENISTNIVSRLYRDVYRETDVVPLQVSAAAKQALAEGRLHSCQVCGTVGEIDSRELRKGGFLYEQAIEQDPYLVDGKIYELPNCLYLKYDIESDVLSPVEEKCHPRCLICNTLTSVISTKRSASATDKRMRSPIQVRTQKKQTNQKTNTIDSNTINKPSSSSGNLRIKVRLSDNRTDIMELAKDITVSTFLSLLSDKFGINLGQIHSIRSGHPPRVLDRTRPQSPVSFTNGDRVDVVLGDPGGSSTSSGLQTSPVERRKIQNKTDQPSLKLSKLNSEIPNTKYPDHIPKDVQELWRDAERDRSSIWNTILSGIGDSKYKSLFSREGGYYTLTCLMKGLNKLEIGSHHTLMRMPDVVFYWSGEEFQLCTGPECHKSVTDVFLYTVTTNDFKHNCINLSRLRQTTESGPGINRLGGNSLAPPRDISDELRKRLSSKR